MSQSAAKDVMGLYLDSSKGAFIVAEDKDKIVGYICAVPSIARTWLTLLTPRWILRSWLFLFPKRVEYITPRKLSHAFSGHIISMAVAKQYRKKGIGTKLADACVKRMREIGVKKIIFETDSGNKAVLNIYSNLGFKRTKEYNEKRLGKWCMLKKTL